MYNKKFNLSINYQNYSENKDIINFKVSLNNGEKSLFNFTETLIKNDEAYNFINNNKIDTFKIYHNYDGVYVYLYYIDSLNKWFVSTKREISNYKIYSAFFRALRLQNINLQSFDKNYVYIFNLNSYKITNYKPVNPFGERLILLKKINKFDNSVSYNIEDRFNHLKQFDDFNPLFGNAKNIIAEQIKRELEKCNKNPFTSCCGLCVYCYIGNKTTVLIFDTDLYKYIKKYKYNYQKYKINIKDSLYYDYILTHETERLREIETILPEVKENINQYYSEFDKFITFLTINFKNQEYKNNTLRYFYNTLEKENINFSNPDLKEDIKLYILSLINLNVFYSLYKTYKGITEIKTIN